MSYGWLADVAGPFVSAIMCFPMLVAHWCWPVLLGTVLGMVVSKESMTMSYVAQFSILLVIMTNCCQYLLTSGFQKQSYLPHFERFGSYYIMCLASVLILVAPLKTLAVDLAMTSFKAYGFNATIERTLQFFYAPEFAQLPLQIYTGVAYLLMFWVMIRQLNLLDRFNCCSKREASGEVPLMKKESDECVGGSWP